MPVFVVLDRVEPEPRVAKIYTFLYGAFVATSVAVIVNGIAAGLLGDSAATVLSAPFIEESMKLLGILWAYRKKLVNGPLDGAVYAAIIALGFASVENILYFAVAASDGTLSLTFVMRGIFSPFAHPLFTIWTGIFLGKAILLGRRISNYVAMGLALSICLHLTWNLTAVLSGFSGVFPLLFMPLFIALFAYSIYYIVKLRKEEEIGMTKFVSVISNEFGIDYEQAKTFGYFRYALEIRKHLNRKQKRIFDRQRVAFSRLASMMTSKVTILQNEVDQLVVAIKSF